MTASRTRTRRLAAIVIAVAALAALLPAGASAASPARARDAVPAALVDTLWAVKGDSIAGCADPASPASLAGCFGTAVSAVGGSTVLATDGDYVLASRWPDSGRNGAWRCPVADAGAGCAHVMGGPWPIRSRVSSYAAADGSLWIGQANGSLYRCPSDIPYENVNTAPAACVQLDDAGRTVVDSLLLANSRLYAGLGNGIVWSCDPYLANACHYLDDAGTANVESLAAGAGYLWAGLDNGIIWRCDPYFADRCTTWDTGPGAIQSLSYDGAGTLYAAVNGTSGAGTIWSCPVATKDACSEVIPDVNGISVAAGAGSVFFSHSESDGSGPIAFGTLPFTGMDRTWVGAQLLYVPAGGLPALGAANVQVGFPDAAKRLAARCADGVPLIAHVRVTGPHGFRLKRTVDVCRIRNPRMPDVRLGLLDPGTYHVRVRTPKHEAEGSVVVTGGSTRPLILQLRGRR